MCDIGFLGIVQLAQILLGIPELPQVNSVDDCITCSRAARGVWFSQGVMEFPGTLDPEAYTAHTPPTA